MLKAEIYYVTEIGIQNVDEGQNENADINSNSSVSKSITLKAEEARKARALIFIVVMMAISNIPRMLLSLHEAIYIIPNHFKEHERYLRKCQAYPSFQIPHSYFIFFPTHICIFLMLCLKR